MSFDVVRGAVLCLSRPYGSGVWRGSVTVATETAAQLQRLSQQFFLVARLAVEPHGGVSAT